MSYAKVLGATNRQDGYLEGNGYLVSWCIGHLVELAPPNVYPSCFSYSRKDLFQIAFFKNVIHPVNPPFNKISAVIQRFFYII